MRVITSRRHLPHIYIAGACYFLTFRLAAGRQAPMNGDERDRVVEHLGRMKPGTPKAWVVMPDHVHVLYQSDGGEDLRATLKSLKGSSSRTLCREFGRLAPVWQDETFDRVIRSERELLETWRYIEANPVRTGLVAVPEQYRWSSARVRL